MSVTVGEALGVAVESKPIGGVDGGRYHGRLWNQRVCQPCTGFSRKACLLKALAGVTRRRPVLADRLHHLAMPAVLPFHVHNNERMSRRHQQQDVKNQSENHAKHA